MIVLRQLALILLLIAGSVQLCQAQTLFQRSMVQFRAKELKATPDDYCFVVLGDSRNGDEVFRRALRLARKYEPLFILHGGDYSVRGGAAESANFLALVNETAPEIPLFVVLGNHENRDVFASRIGPSHFTISSRWLGLDLIALDDAEDALRAPELDYLRNQLRRGGKAKFVAMHVPPQTERWTWHVFSEGEEEFKSILEKNPVQGLFFSHVHLYDRAVFAGIPAFITGGAGAPLTTFGYPGDPVFHFVLVRVKNGKASFQKVPIP